MCKESKTKQNATTVQNIPGWLEDASKSLTEKASAYADKPFEAYTGERVAGFSPDQQNAFQMLRDFIGTGGTVDTIKNASSQPAQNIGTERVVDEGGRLGAMKDYFNPYVDGALQPALAQIQKQADERRKNINSGATAARAFGDARHGILESTLDQNTSQAIGDTAAKFYSDAFDKSMNTRAADLNRFGEVDKANAQFGEQALNREISGAQTAQQALLQQLQAALQTGGLQQGVDQAGLQAAYEEFMRKNQHDPQMLAQLSAVLSKLPYSKTQTTNAESIAPDNSLLGTAGAVGGAVAGSAPVSAAIAGLLAGI